MSGPMADVQSSWSVFYDAVCDWTERVTWLANTRPVGIYVAREREERPCAAFRLLAQRSVTLGAGKTLPPAVHYVVPFMWCRVAIVVEAAWHSNVMH